MWWFKKKKTHPADGPANGIFDQPSLKIKRDNFLEGSNSEWSESLQRSESPSRWPRLRDLRLSLFQKEGFLYKYPLLSLFLIMIVSRLYVLGFPPPYYSDVKQDYERYANIWWYGMEPYKEHYFEYPPATIPLVIFPLLADQLGVGKYYFDYRVIIAIFDICLFWILLKALKRQYELKKQFWLASGFYIIAGVVAKDFYYEGIDLVFIGTWCLSILSDGQSSLPIWRRRLLAWFWAWLSFAVKFVSIPLFPLLFLVKKQNVWKEVIVCGLGFLLVWAVPLFWYRSSLQVSYVFHANRPLKYSSIGSYAIEVINGFAKTDERVPKPPDFHFEGPIAVQATRVVSIVFPLSILVVLAIAGWKLFVREQNSPAANAPASLRIKRGMTLQFLTNIVEFLMNPIQKDWIYRQQFLLKSSLLYFTTIFITAKVFSQPFPIWLIPLSTLYPFQDSDKQKRYYLIVFLFIILMTTPWVGYIIPLQSVWLPPFTNDFFVQTVRVVVMIVLWVATWKLDWLGYQMVSNK